MIPRVSKKERKDVEIAIVNMVDVVFVLVIFFVLTTTFTKETGIDINKPKASSSKQLAKRPIIIGVSRTGEIHVNDRQVDFSILRSLLKRSALEDSNPTVVIQSDKQAEMGVVVKILDVCNELGIKNSSVSTEAG